MQIRLFQIIILALIQGSTELFPISSLGHTVIIPGLLKWGSIITSDRFVPLVVALHLGTSIALIIYFWKDWWQLLVTLYTSVKDGKVEQRSKEWESWLIIIGTIPTGLIGLFLESPLKKLFATPIIASIFLAVNGVVLLIAERLKKNENRQTRSLSDLSWKEGLIVGLAQSFALIPGISRSGSSMVGGLVLGLSHEDSARFSFLLGAPIIAAASLLEIPQLAGLSERMLLYVLIGMIISGITAFFSTKFLLKYFENGNLNPFGYYCIVAGLASLSIFLFLIH